MQRFVETVSLALGIMMIAAMVGLVAAQPWNRISPHDTF